MADLLELLVGEDSSAIYVGGPPASGKYRAIRLLKASNAPEKELIALNISDSLESADLISTTVVGDKPGEFKARFGALHNAVVEGHWVVLRHLELVPDEALAIFKPLISDRELHFGGGMRIQAHADFRLFATGPSDSPLASGWARVILPSIDPSSGRFPAMDGVLTSGIKGFMARMFTKVDEVARDPAHPTAERGTRGPSLHDLFRAIERVARDAGDPATLPGHGEDCVQFDGSPSSNRVARLVWRELNNVLISFIPGEAVRQRIRDRVLPDLSLSTTPDPVPYYGTPDFGAITNGSLVLTKHLEQTVYEVMGCVANNEPALLVGETGLGKTAAVQYLAQCMGKQLAVLNLSQQTASSDLLGGFEPVNVSMEITALSEAVAQAYNGVDLIPKADGPERKRDNSEPDDQADPRAKVNGILAKAKAARQDGEFAKAAKLLFNLARVLADKKPEFVGLRDRAAEVRAKAQAHDSNAMAFEFRLGEVVKALEEGSWVLLDEVNLATADTLEKLASLVDGGSVLLTEKGEHTAVTRHPDFRLFAAMNPATDAGKKDLPPALRARFVELYIAETRAEGDVVMIARHYLTVNRTDTAWAAPLSFLEDRLGKLYLKLSDRDRIAGMSVISGTETPTFTLRSLRRAIEYGCKAYHGGLYTSNCGLSGADVGRSYDLLLPARLALALMDGVDLLFASMLDTASCTAVRHEIVSHLWVGFLEAVKANTVDQGRKQVLDQMLGRTPGKGVTADPFTGDTMPEPDALMAKLVTEGATLTPDDTFIVTATVARNMRFVCRALMGDEPILLQGPTSAGKTSVVCHIARMTGHQYLRINNHAHTDVQEYLGRYVPTEGGAFEFRPGMLVTALERGSWLILDELNLAPSDVLEALNRLLDDNKELFIPELGKSVKPAPGFRIFATQNPSGTYGGRSRLSRAFRNRFVEIHCAEYSEADLSEILRFPGLDQQAVVIESVNQLMIKTLKTLQRVRRENDAFRGAEAVMTLRDLFRWRDRLRDPETGGYDTATREVLVRGFVLLSGKLRTAAERQALASALVQVGGRTLCIELLRGTGDSAIPKEGKKGKIDTALVARTRPHFLRAVDNYLESVAEGAVAMLARQAPHIQWEGPIRLLAGRLELCRRYREPALLVGPTGCGKTSAVEAFARCNTHDGRPGECVVLNVHQHTEASDFLGDIRAGPNRTFAWVDGPLVAAMVSGDYFLIDEISLCPDSVLERLNSVLEPERMLSIPECTDPAKQVITAADQFRVFATMNPSGDFGKRELSPALRSRFTEIWVDAPSSPADLAKVAVHRCPSIAQIRDKLEADLATVLELGLTLSVRDVAGVTEMFACLHGQFANTMAAPTALDHAMQALVLDGHPELPVVVSEGCEPQSDFTVVPSEQRVGIAPFFVDSLIPADAPQPEVPYSFDAATPKTNTFRLLRAMQTDLPMLLEGSPGVGKTSLITAIAQVTGHELIRVNLSEQTDLIDLVGCFIPQEDGSFMYVDGPLLDAMRHGKWILIDEINLASQTVLEGLNSVLDHRREVHTVSGTVKAAPGFRVFAAQNPASQGGGRKRLPKSFLNRFIQVWMAELTTEDLRAIVYRLFPGLDHAVLDKCLEVNAKIAQATTAAGLDRIGRSGAPWEFNLRDVTKLIDLAPDNPLEAFGALYISRFRTPSDRVAARKLFETTVGAPFVWPAPPLPPFRTNTGLHILGTVLPVQTPAPTRPETLPLNLEAMASAARALDQSWPVLVIGPSATGKSTLSTMLADHMGLPTRVITLTGATDVSDLIGGFQQIDERQRALRRIDAMQFVLRVLGADAAELKDRLAALAVDVHRELDVYDELDAVYASIGALLVETAHPDAVRLARMSAPPPADRHGPFEWVDGPLLTAMQRGECVILDGVNLCPTAVLDRLNPLLEAERTMPLVEKGGYEVVKADERFKIILLMDPIYGEISRAIRNRSMEIYLSPADRSRMLTIAADFGLGPGALDALSAVSPYSAQADVIRYLRALQFLRRVGPDRQAVATALRTVTDIAPDPAVLDVVLGTGNSTPFHLRPHGKDGWTWVAAESYKALCQRFMEDGDATVTSPDGVLAHSMTLIARPDVSVFGSTPLDARRREIASTSEAIAEGMHPLLAKLWAVVAASTRLTDVSQAFGVLTALTALYPSIPDSIAGTHFTLPDEIKGALDGYQRIGGLAIIAHPQPVLFSDALRIPGGPQERRVALRGLVTGRLTPAVREALEDPSVVGSARALAFGLLQLASIDGAGDPTSLGCGAAC
ncbi:hypothetical protein J8273_1560 [Carpediemonas membranifera]|uniref:Midasin n=1 Tax=Carpediemonas membranifera TaxID=201153 RepID=A0A8J6BFS1_9EUKA|nr:hypothetical protein J8273_1560 [Carpediemonas membranifera]|eukprot:KAG9396552.1 hypothetical protein J8273_1560 [Carpediemonas membranifera]